MLFRPKVQAMLRLTHQICLTKCSSSRSAVTRLQTGQIVQLKFWRSARINRHIKIMFSHGSVSRENTDVSIRLLRDNVQDRRDVFQHMLTQIQMFAGCGKVYGQGLMPFAKRDGPKWKGRCV